MDFDQIGEQHVSRRRKPSPARKTRQSPSALDSDFSQHVSPRTGHTGMTSHAGTAGKAGSAHDGGKQEKTGNARNQKPARPAAGFTISPSFFKKLAIGGGILVVAVVGPNWAAISGGISMGISDDSLVGTAMPGRDATVGSVPAWEILSTPHSHAEEAPELPSGEMPFTLTEAFTWTEYLTKERDTVYGIAAKFSLSMSSIIAFNGLNEANNLPIGKKLKIPNMDGLPYTVVKNDNLSKIAAKYKVPVNAILDANDMPNDIVRQGEVLFLPGAKMTAAELSQAVKKPEVSSKIMIKPVPGRVTSDYAWRQDPVNPQPGAKPRFHFAIDYAGRIGQPVAAALQGKVLNMDYNSTYGNFIILKHDGYETLYAHLSAFSVKMGDTVKQGQEIGKVGDTGYTTGPHLHFAVFKNGTPVNPLDLLK